MKKSWIALSALILAGSASAGEPEMVKITGDRVSLRVAPEINAGLIDRAMSGDLLMLRDDLNPEWIGVAPPEDVDVWVHSEFIAGDQVIPARLNIRYGPSLNHGVVGVVSKGDTLTVRGEAGGWLRIAPPESTVVWVSRKYADVIGAPQRPTTVIRVEPMLEPVAAEMVKIEPVVIVEDVSTPESGLEPAITGRNSGSVQIVETVFQPEINEVMVTATQSLELLDTLVPDPDKVQGVEESFSGILRPSTGVLSMLVSLNAGQSTVCYVRGNAAQMKAYAGLPLKITGKAYRAVGLDMPILVPVKIQILSRSKD